MQDSVPSSHTRSRTGDPAARAGASAGTAGTPRASRVADLAYSSFYSGALGGSAIALLFLILDAVRGEALFTPSLLGTALFTGADAATVATVRLDMVAYFSAVHFAAFFTLGGIASRLYVDTDALRGRVGRLAVVIFVLMTGALFAADLLLMSGAVSRVGIVPVLVANAVTAGVMASFIGRALANRVA
jgi:hypothetical protein